MSQQLANGLTLHGLCIQCSAECSIRLVDDQIPEKGEVIYQAECARHSENGRPAEEIQALPEDAARAVRRNVKLRRHQTVCCFES